MFNAKLKKRVKELEIKLEYQKRWNGEISDLLRRLCRRIDKLENKSWLK